MLVLLLQCNNGIKRATGDYIAFKIPTIFGYLIKMKKQIAFYGRDYVKWSHVGFYYWWPETGKQFL